MRKVFFAVIVASVVFCDQFVLSMTFEKKCQEVSKKLLRAIMLVHTENFGISLAKKNYQGDLDHHNVGGNCCAVAFIDDELQDTYLEYKMLPNNLKEVSVKKNVQGTDIAVFKSGGNDVTHDVFAMFNVHYIQLFPAQGIQITPPQGRHVDAEEQLLLALDNRYVREHLQSKKWRTMIIVSSMDTCKYCAISVSGFLSLNQRLSFVSNDAPYRLKSVKIYFPFSYDDPTMKLVLKNDSHILLLPPHVEHVQFDKKQSVDVIAKSAQTTNNIALLTALYQQTDEVFELEVDFLKHCLDLEDTAEKSNLFSCPKFQEALLYFATTDKIVELCKCSTKGMELIRLVIKRCLDLNITRDTSDWRVFSTFVRNICTIKSLNRDIQNFIFGKMNNNLSIIDSKKDMIIEILDAVGPLTTDDISNEYKRKGEMIKRMRGIGIRI